VASRCRLPLGRNVVLRLLTRRRRAGVGVDLVRLGTLMQALPDFDQSRFAAIRFQARADQLFEDPCPFVYSAFNPGIRAR